MGETRQVGDACVEDGEGRGECVGRIAEGGECAGERSLGGGLEGHLHGVVD